MSLKIVRRYLVVAIIVFGIAYGGFSLGRYLTEKELSNEANVDTRVMNVVLSRLKESYLKPEDIDVDKLKYGAAEGITASLGDPYTAFFPPKENLRSREDLQGEFGGVGIQLGFIDHTLAVMSPLKDTPAMKAGLLSGDLILKIVDEKKEIDVDTGDLGIDEAVDLIRGEVGTPVTLTIFREGELQSREVVIVREVINVSSTELVWLENSTVALIRVNKFGEKTLPEWQKIVYDIKAKNTKGVILDLRNNPGGYLQRAVELGSEFIQDGVIVRQKDRQMTEDLRSSGRGKLIGMPLIVLINRGSASASEILAGALRERLGIKLVGDRSFGKGTVQEAQEIGDGSSLHVTIAEWLLPSGKNIHGDGLEPDVEVAYLFDEKDPEADNQLDKALEVLKEEIGK